MHDGFRVVGHGIDRIDFVCREPAGDLAGLRARAKVVGSRRWVVDRLGAGTQWGGRDTGDGVVLWVDSNLRHLPVQALKFTESAVLELLDREAIHAQPPVVRRLDLATDIAFAAAGDAQQVLLALSGLTIPNHKLCVYYAKGSKRVESLAWSVGERVRFRVYDSVARDSTRVVDGWEGVLRFERQVTLRRQQQPTVDALRTWDFAAHAIAPLDTGIAGSPRVVADLRALDTLLRAVSSADAKGDVVAERRLGTLVRAYLDGADAWSNRRSAYARATELRQLGLSLNPELAAPFALAPLFVAVRDAWRAEQKA